MKRMAFLTALVLIAAAMPMLAQPPALRAGAQNFASDFQTLPVTSNVNGVGGSRFQTYLAILNPTASAFTVTASLYDANGTKRDATINLAAGELKTFDNFLEAVFNTTGGGAVTFSAPESAGGTHNNRFIINAEIWTTGTRYGTTVPVLEFAGSSSPQYSPGISTDSTSRTNIGCFNQANAANAIKATVYDKSGTQTIGTFNLNLPANAWGQTAVTSVVTNGLVKFEPSDSAVCYAVVVNNGTNDGHLVAATEFRP